LPLLLRAWFDDVRFVFFDIFMLVKPEKISPEKRKKLCPCCVPTFLSPVESCRDYVAIFLSFLSQQTFYFFFLIMQLFYKIMFVQINFFFQDLTAAV